MKLISDPSPQLMSNVSAWLAASSIPVKTNVIVGSLLKVISSLRISVFKSAQAAPVVIISPRSRGFSNRETIINKYAGAYEFNEQKLINFILSQLFF